MSQEQKLVDLVQGFSNAMLVTHGVSGHLEARPMAIAEVEESGDVWFVTDRDSGKVDDVAADRQVAVTTQSSNQFVSLSGKCQLVDDRSKLESLWKETWKIWFPAGKSDPNIVLLKVTPDHGEFWDHSGTAGIRYLIKAGKAYIAGERPEPDDDTNASVSLP